MDEGPREFPQRSRLQRFVLAAAIASAVLVLAALCLCLIPQPLDDLSLDDADAKPPRDLREALERSLKRGEPVVFTQEEINRWLVQRRAPQAQAKPVGMPTAERIVVRLLDGQAELVMRRRMLGVPMTVSMFVRIERRADGSKQAHLHGGRYAEWLSHPLRGGRFGRLTIPQGFLVMALPAFSRTARSLDDEIRLAFEDMSVIRIEPGRLVLDPLEPQAGNPASSTVF
ncbi:MAG: hypothetical protein FJ385_08105 [Verrucomicrobia bacterium]|nr:hypothetical protein [Verrucomicrobiota bacterium]